MSDLYVLILFRVFCWLSAKFFSAVRVYSQDGQIRAMHFGVNEWHLKQSISRLCQDEAD